MTVNQGSLRSNVNVCGLIQGRVISPCNQSLLSSTRKEQSSRLKWSQC